MQRKKRSSRPNVPRSKQHAVSQAKQHAASHKSLNNQTHNQANYLSATSNTNAHANSMKDYVSPHARQKKKHMDMIAVSLLNLHESYFLSPSPPSTNKVSSLASLLREGGGFHAPTSTVTPTALLSLTDTAPQALAKIFSESNPRAAIPSPEHLASYLGSLDYTAFYQVRAASPRSPPTPIKILTPPPLPPPPAAVPCPLRHAHDPLPHDP